MSGMYILNLSRGHVNDACEVTERTSWLVARHLSGVIHLDSENIVESAEVASNV